MFYVVVAFVDLKVINFQFYLRYSWTTVKVVPEVQLEAFQFYSRYSINARSVDSIYDVLTFNSILDVRNSTSSIRGLSIYSVLSLVSSEDILLNFFVVMRSINVIYLVMFLKSYGLRHNHSQGRP